MKRISPYLEVHRNEVRLARLRELLEEKRLADHDAYIQMRASISVFDLIEIEGEKARDALIKRGNFTEGEIALRSL